MPEEIPVSVESGNDLAPYVEKSVNLALGKLEMKYEKSPEDDENLEFHNKAHTANVLQRVEAILSIVHEADPSAASVRDIQLGKFAAGFHDRIQNFRAKFGMGGAQNQFATEKRERTGFKNEELSANEAVAVMDDVNREAGKEIFSLDDKIVVRQAIEATVAGIATVPAGGHFYKTVRQFNMKENSRIVAKALAFADLGTVGMDDPEKYLAEGAALLREERLDIKRALEKPETLTPELKKFFHEEIIKWLDFQVEFAEGRKAVFAEEIQWMPGAARDGLQTLFNKFDANIAAARERARDARMLSFEDLCKLMGYRL